MANTHPSAQRKGHPVAEDVAAFMKRHNVPDGSGTQDHAGQPVSASGKTMPTKQDASPVGFQSVNSHGSAQSGRSEPASDFQGTGKKKTELSPNNTKHAGSQTKGKAKGLGKLPSANAINRRLYGKNLPSPATPSKAPSAKDGAGRTGILSNFEGFNKNS